jgi:hypothetical protein
VSISVLILPLCKFIQLFQYFTALDTFVSLIVKFSGIHYLMFLSLRFNFRDRKSVMPLLNYLHLLHLLTLKMEEIMFFQNVGVLQTTQCHIPGRWYF